MSASAAADLAIHGLRRLGLSVTMLLGLELELALPFNENDDRPLRAPEKALHRQKGRSVNHILELHVPRTSEATTPIPMEQHSHIRAFPHSSTTSNLTHHPTTIASTSSNPKPFPFPCLHNIHRHRSTAFFSWFRIIRGGSMRSFTGVISSLSLSLSLSKGWVGVYKENVLHWIFFPSGVISVRAGFGV